MSWREDWEYLSSIKAYIALSAVLFTATAFLGYQAAVYNPAFASQWTKELEMLRWITSLHPLWVMAAIFLKNMIACTMAVLLGLGLGIVPFFVASSNGMLLGVVSYSILEEHGGAFLIAGVAPHGIIELPVVLMCIGMGLRLGHRLIYAILGEKANLVMETKASLRILFRLAMPLLLLAAIIETFITPLAISMVSR